MFERFKKNTEPSIEMYGQKETKPGRGTYVFLLGVIFILIGVIVVMWLGRMDLSKTNEQKVRDFYTKLSSSQIAFTDTGDIVFPDEQKFISQKQQYVQDKISFVEANLKTMKLTLYENGEALKEIDIASKGRKGSWWETPTGNYKALGKEVNHYSTIGEVWMPYSIQFYGNFFIHGWPYYDNGTPVSSNYSGGCIRLTNDNAKIAFDFITNKMPILVYSGEEDTHFGVINQKATDAVLPSIGANYFKIFNLASGKTIVEKNAGEKITMGSMTKLMTAVVAHELIHLSKTIKVTSQAMTANVSSVFQPQVGDGYTGFDLLYPLLMQSSDEAANIFASFLGEKDFVRNMNAKAKSISMTDSIFADPTGKDSGNISTLNDVSKLLQYIYYRRPFIFEITKGKEFNSFGLAKVGDTVNISDLKNFNQLVDDEDLVGVNSGVGSTTGQTMATVWNIHTKDGDVPVAIVVSGSIDSVKDTKNLLNWLKTNFDVI